MYEKIQARLNAAVDAIVESKAPRKLVVAGPGTGKTYLFRKLLEACEGDENDRLVLTFINNLKDDLQRDLAGLAQVYTFHGYCRRLLHQKPRLREGLSEGFHYYPPLPSLICSDWVITHEGLPPMFVGIMRDLTESEDLTFYLNRAKYYDAVSFDDSVFRVYTGFQNHSEEIDQYQLLLVDEYQDFNRLEVEFIRTLATNSSTVIAGDDDQALYSRLRSSSPTYIRDLHSEGEYQSFPLPFCMRCTRPIVETVSHIVRRAQGLGKLRGRIDKPYEFYPPKKQNDTQQYPRIKVVETSVQRNDGANYFGRYIEEQLQLIPGDEIQESQEGNFPTVLIIGPSQYLRQIKNHLENADFPCQARGSEDSVEIDRKDGLRILRENPASNLGWRVILEADQPASRDEAIRRSVAEALPLTEFLMGKFKSGILAEAKAFRDEDDAIGEDQDEQGAARLSIKLTSFEGSKGLSAQHVFVVGLHEGDLPRDSHNPTDLEICKFLVALTRTRKQCHLIHTWRWGADPKRPSVFLGWINAAWQERIRVNAEYWRK